MGVRFLLQTPAVLLSWKQPRYILYRRLGGLQDLSGCGDEVKIPLPAPADNWTSVAKACNLAIVLIELP